MSLPYAIIIIRNGQMKKVLEKIGMNNPCVNCGDNEAIDGFYCFGCGIDIYYSETIFETAEAN
jgi:hypothetical protein